MNTVFARIRSDAPVWSRRKTVWSWSSFVIRILLRILLFIVVWLSVFLLLRQTILHPTQYVSSVLYATGSIQEYADDTLYEEMTLAVYDRTILSLRLGWLDAIVDRLQVDHPIVQDIQIQSFSMGQIVLQPLFVSPDFVIEQGSNRRWVYGDISILFASGDKVDDVAPAMKLAPYVPPLDSLDGIFVQVQADELLRAFNDIRQFFSWFSYIEYLPGAAKIAVVFGQADDLHIVYINLVDSLDEQLKDYNRIASAYTWLQSSSVVDLGSTDVVIIRP